MKRNGSGGKYSYTHCDPNRSMRRPFLVLRWDHHDAPNRTRLDNNAQRSILTVDCEDAIGPLADAVYLDFRSLKAQCEIHRLKPPTAEKNYFASDRK
jgi:hypothetical protein